MFKYVRFIIWFVAREVFPALWKTGRSRERQTPKTARKRRKKEPQIVLSKRDICLLATVGLLIVGAASLILWNVTTGPARALADQRRADLEQLRRDYHLSEPQFQQVKAWRDDYLPKCDVMCNETEESYAALQRAIRQQLDAAKIEALRQQYTARQEFCRQASLEHHAQVSRCMNPDDAKSYLAVMQSRLAPTKDETAAMQRPR
jgi:hypothetical protein